MLNRLILKVTKFQLPPSKRLDTVVKNILGGPSCPPPPCQVGLTLQIDCLSSVRDLREQEEKYNLIPIPKKDSTQSAVEWILPPPPPLKRKEKQ